MMGLNLGQPFGFGGRPDFDPPFQFQAGQTLHGRIVWVQKVILSVNRIPRPVWVGAVRGDDTYGFVPASCPVDLLKFEFWSTTGFDANENVVFDLAQKPFGLVATNVQPLATLEDTAAIAIRLLHKGGQHLSATELQQQLDDLWT